MQEQFRDWVIPTLAQHLGVSQREIAPVHDLQRDWGFTPLSLVVVLLDLERLVAIELPSHKLSQVRTVGDLIGKFRGWLRARGPERSALPVRRARRSRHTLRERRLRRELHHLRWLEQNEKQHAPARTRNALRRAS